MAGRDGALAGRQQGSHDEDAIEVPGGGSEDGLKRFGPQGQEIGDRIAGARRALGSSASRLCYWSWQNRWKDVGDMEGLFLDQALDTVAKTDIFRI